MKTKKSLSIIITLTMVISIFAGYAVSANAAKKKIVIGLSLPTQREERWVRDKKAMEAEAKKLGVTLKIQISDTDVAVQASQVENLLSQGVDALILAPVDGTASAASVDKAHAQGIKVVSYDRLIMGSKPDLYVSFDNEKVGELQGQYITKKVPKGNYIVMSGAPTDNNAKLFLAGAMKYIQPLADKGQIKIVTKQAVDNWEPKNAEKIVEDALTKNKNNVQAILAPNDGTAGGAIVALTAQGLAGKVPVTGQDSEVTAAQRIVKGTQSMTIFKDTRVTAAYAVDAAVAFAKGQKAKTNAKVNNTKIDVPSYLVAPTVVDKNNIDKVLIGSGYLKKSDIYKK